MLVARLVPFTLFAPLAEPLSIAGRVATVMIVADLARAVVALALLFVHVPKICGFAYLCTVLLALFTAFFEAAKNAAVPNITGDSDLLAGTALMWSSRFL